MKIFNRILFMFFAALLFTFCQQQNETMEPVEPATYTISFKEYPKQPAPGLQSFAFAEEGDNWLVVAGRINGFHGTANTNPNRTFPKKFANTNIWVINKDSSKAWKTSVPRQYLPFLSSANPEHYQDGNTLYVCGGYGSDAKGNYTTFPYLAAINVSGIINAIVTADTSNISQFITVVEDTLFKVAGGELLKLDDYFYLCVGQDFEGIYDAAKTGNYTDQVRKLKIDYDSSGLRHQFIASYSDGLPDSTTQFHRRDLNVMPVIRPDGTNGISIYGGVFTPVTNTGYVYPINIYNDSSGTVAVVDSSFEQRMAQYDCANISIYDSAGNNMYSTFLGGISLYAYENGILKPDLNLPFINSVYTIRRNASGVYSDYPQPDSLLLPGYIGAEMVFIPLDDLLLDGSSVIMDFNKISPNGGLIGYCYGGIVSKFPQSSQLYPTVANNKIYEVYISFN